MSEVKENLRRRSQTRKPFIASALIFEPKSETRLQARIADLGLDGCFIDTLNPFLPGTTVRVRIDKGGASFESWARVVYSLSSMGMGMVFQLVAPEQMWVLHNWLNDRMGNALLQEMSLPAAPNKIPAPVFRTADKTKDVHCEALGQLISELINPGLLSEEKGKAILQTLGRSPATNS